MSISVTFVFKTIALFMNPSGGKNKEQMLWWESDILTGC